MTLVVFLSDEAPTWWRVEDGAVVARGTGVEVAAEPERAMLVVPAAAVTIHRAVLPDLAARQAAAAARLMALENALAPADELHVATGPRDGEGGIDVAVVANAEMVRWLGWASDHGLDAGPVVPASLMLPRPEEGYALATIGAERVARSGSTAFALEPGIAELVIGDAAVAETAPEEIEAAVIAALADPPVDLRQGVFARRKRTAFDWALARRAAVLVGLILLLSLVISVTLIWRLNGDTERLDANALVQARTVLPELTDVAQAESALDARAVSQGVGGRGFSASAARLLAALDQSPAAALTQFETTPDGAIRATIAGTQPNDIDIVVAALRASGAGVEATPTQVADGRQTATVTVTSK